MLMCVRKGGKINSTDLVRFRRRKKSPFERMKATFQEWKEEERERGESPLLLICAQPDRLISQNHILVMRCRIRC